jgi:threonine dehydratase
MINPISKNDIADAHQRIVQYVHRTPVFTSATVDNLLKAEVFFKCENFQKIGAFKIRGAMNAALQIEKEKLKRGLLTHSSGNHAQAIAYAAKILQTQAYIVMPSTSPKVKVNAVKGYGAKVIFCEPNQAAREQTAEKVQLETGATFIPPYDHDHVIAGQATVAKELIEDIDHLDFVMAPVGGGGLLSGTALSTKFWKNDAMVYGAEPEGAADAVRSFQSGIVEKAPFVDTIADGLLTSLSERTLFHIRKHVSDILLVNDPEILSSLRLVYERMKIVIEPSCAVPLAAAIKHQKLFEGKRVGIILSGGNVDLAKFGKWFSD